MNLNATLFAQFAVFFVLAWVTMKFIWPPLIKALDERAKKIADGLAAAEKAKQDFELAEKGAAEKLREAKAQASEIIAQAEKRSAMLLDEAKQAARTEGERLIAGAKAELDQQVQQAKESLRQQVADLALAGAEQILRKEVNASAHADLLTSLKAEL